MYREKLMSQNSTPSENSSLTHTKTNSPVGFRLFALTVDQPQVILRLF